MSEKLRAALDKQREDIARWIEGADNARGRSRHVRRLLRAMAEGVRNRFDQPDEAAPAGERARYNDEVPRS
jgi:hypothetical protein